MAESITKDLIKTLLSLSKEKREILYAAVEAAEDAIGPPSRIGRPRGSKSKPRVEPPAIPVLTGQVINTVDEEHA